LDLPARARFLLLQEVDRSKWSSMARFPRPHRFPKGALAENYVMQALVTNGFSPYYWSSEGKAELDFVFQDRQGDIIPLETKSSENVRAKSLKNYMSRFQPPYALRVSAKNFGCKNNIKSIPLYALFCLQP
jgi:predicted AAA+ superfamily ATPase